MQHAAFADGPLLRSIVDSEKSNQDVINGFRLRATMMTSAEQKAGLVAWQCAGKSVINKFLISIVMISLKRNHRRNDDENNLDSPQS